MHPIKSASVQALFFLLLSTPPSFPQQVVIDFVGDCTIGNDVRWPIFDTVVAARGYGWFFSGVQSLLGADDYTVANLETTIIDSGTPLEKMFRFRGKPDYLEILKQGSVDGVTIANNHSWDYGDSGFAQTQRNLEKYGIDFFAYDKVLRKEFKGMTFSFFGLSFSLPDQVVPRIRSIRDSVDFIIVCMHWGNEREYRPNKTQVSMAHALIDAGADIIVGHHPHVLQPVLSYRGKHIAYSIGNFVFGGNKNPHDKRTVILRATFEKGKPIVVREFPCKISSVDTVNDFRPVLINGDN
jgi:poly-gamma-glutamate capsule biosynthesis protein CapA/YwtB (metallophosphatase superfamily)